MNKQTNTWHSDVYSSSFGRNFFLPPFSTNVCWLQRWLIPYCGLVVWVSHCTSLLTEGKKTYWYNIDYAIDHQGDWSFESFGSALFISHLMFKQNNTKPKKTASHFPHIYFQTTCLAKSARGRSSDSAAFGFMTFSWQCLGGCRHQCCCFLTGFSARHFFPYGVWCAAEKQILRTELKSKI